MDRVSILSCLYPNKCAVCGEIIKDGRVLCDYCGVRLNDLSLKNFCIKCGYEKEKCLCKYREFRFKGIAGAFKNKGVAKTLYYSYKIGKRRELADFLANRVVCVVKKAFGDIEFDAVCAVPTTKISRFKRGFDHTGVIAAKISEILNVEYLEHALKVHPFKRPQHNSLFRQRLENVRGKYYTVNKINKKRILLFDDIYTTGATLDEAAKELMFAGAREVYCIAVLATSLKRYSTG